MKNENGLDWAKITQDYQARLDAEEASGQTPKERLYEQQKAAEAAALKALTPEQLEERRARQRKANREYARRNYVPKGTRPARRKFDRAKILELHKAGATNKEIAAQIGCGADTVTTALREAGIHVRKGPPLKDVCKHGHDMSKTRRRTPKGAPYCGQCKIEKDERLKQEKIRLAQST